MNKESTNQNPKKKKLVAKNNTLDLSIASSILNNTSDGVIGTNLKGEITYWNNGSSQMYKYSKEEVLGKHVTLLYKKENIINAADRIKRVLAGEVFLNEEVQVLDKSGNTLTVLMSLNGIKDEQGKISHVVGITKDITELKLSQKTLENSEHRFSQAFDNSPIPISILNLKTGKRLAVNNSFCKTFGYSKEELVNEENFKKNNIAVDQKVFRSIVKKILSEGTVFEHPFAMYTKSGEIRETLLNASKVYPDNNDVYIASFLDITDRKTVQDALLSSEKKFRNLAKTAQVAIAILNDPPESRFLYVNPFWEKLTGYSSKEAEKLNAKDLVAPDFHKLLSKEAIKSLSKGKSTDRTEFKIITKSGEIKWIKFTAANIDYEGQNAVLRTGLDITKQKNAEQELLQAKEHAEGSEKYLDSIINNIGDPIFVKDDQSKLLLVNDAFCKLFELSKENIIGKTLAEDISLEEMEGFLRVDKQVLDTGKESIIEEALTLQGGETRTIYTRKTRYIDKSGKKYLIGISRDISDLKGIERELKKAQEIAQLGNWYLDISTGEISWSDELYKMYGFDPNLPIPPLSEHKKFLTPESWELLNTSIEHTSNTGKPYSIELMSKKREGVNQWQWIFAQGEAIVDSENNIIAIRGTAQDITERKIVQEKISERDKRLNAIFDHHFQLTGLLDPKGKILAVNKTALNFIGKKEADIVGKFFWDTPYWDSSQKTFVKNAIEKSKSGQFVRFETTHNNRLGEKVQVDFSLNPVFDDDGNLIYIVPEGRDITERIIAEKKIRESEEKYQSFFRDNISALFMIDMKKPISVKLPLKEQVDSIIKHGVISDANKAIAKSFGVKNPADLIGLPLTSIYSPESLLPNGNVFRSYKQFIRNGYNMMNSESEETTNSGELKWYLNNSKGIVKDNHLVRILGSAIDITEKKIAEEHLKESEEKYRTLFEQSLVGIGLARGNEVIFGNKAMMALWKYDNLEDYKKIPLINHIAQDSRELVRTRIKEGLANKGKKLPPEYQYNIICKDGEIRTVRGHTSYMEIGGEIYAQTVVMDVTERKKAEDKLEQANLELKEAVSSLNELKKQLEDQNIYLKNQLDMVFNFEEMVYGSAVFSNVLTDLERVAPTDATVLILGESGTGKELLARALHNLSLRKDKPFIKVNCSAIPSELIESEFFGHKKGSFTGAVSDKIGKFELANGGTLFLDEIGDLPLAMQPKLLRFLQEGEMEVVGGVETKSLEVRIVAATNKKLQEEVSKAQFREDLFFRLNVFPINVPALRDRKEDIPLLVEHFIDKFGKKYRKNIKYISDSAMQDIRVYDWPGNIRELENLVERSVILSDSETLILPGFGSEMSKKSRPISSTHLTLNDVQRNHILSVLEKTNWKIDGPEGAAQILDIKPSTFRDKMKKLSIKRPKKQ